MFACMSVCLSVRLYVCSYGCLHFRMSPCMSLCFSVCPYVCLYVRMSACMLVCMSVSLSFCPYVCIYYCLYLRMCVYMSVSACDLCPFSDTRKPEVLRLMTSILNYSDEELESLHHSRDKKWLSNVLPTAPFNASPQDASPGQVIIIMYN